MKALPLIAWLILSFSCDLRSAPPEAEKTQPPAPAKLNLRFMAYDGDPKRPEDMHFQVNTPGIRRPTSFLKLGEIVLGTRFKLTKFRFRTRKDPQGRESDVSEVTLENIDTKEAIVLVLGAR